MPNVGQIVDLLGADFSGDRERNITSVRTLSDAGPEDLSFLGNPRYRTQLESTGAGVVLVRRGLEGHSDRWIRVDDPYHALALVLQQWFAEIPRPAAISPDARISASATIGAGARVGAFATIGDHATIGARVTIFEGTSVGAGSVIGDDSILYPNVTLYHGCRIGRRCIVHAGAVIGSDGFGFAAHDGKQVKIPQVGIVRIEDDVEIGAGTTIDRAALGETVIGEGTKIDNLVQIAHNVRIGRHCLIAAQTGIAGSTEVGDYSAFGGQAGVSGHLRIGSQVMVGSRAAVMKSFDGPVTISGAPARPLNEYLRSEALVRKLPELLGRIEELERERGGVREGSGQDPAKRG